MSMGVVAGLADGLLSRLLVTVPPVIEVITEAVSSKGSGGTVALDDPDEDEESRPLVKVPCCSGEEGDEAREEAGEEEELDEEDEEVVEARTGTASLGSNEGAISGSSFALVEAVLGLGSEVGTANVIGSGTGEVLDSVTALSTGSSMPQSTWSTISP